MTSEHDADEYMAKALESLASAEADFEAGRFNSCMNRCYFACFQSAVAALIHDGRVSAHDEHAHHFVQAAFVGLITRRKLYAGIHRSTLPRLIGQRRIGDYRLTKISRSDAREGVRLAREFVAAVASRVN